MSATESDSETMQPEEVRTIINMTAKTSQNQAKTKSVMFQTATAYLKNEKHHRIKVKVLFDPGSDRSMITKATSIRVKMRNHEEMLSISGYGGKSEEAKLHTP